MSAYHQYVKGIFSKIIKELGVSRSAKVITIVFDKSAYLPGIRQTVHEERKQRKMKTKFTCPTVLKDEDQIPHGEIFAEGLTDVRYKSLLIDYISVNFCQLACQLESDITVIIDSPTYDTPIEVKDGQHIPLQERKNNKGEADSGVWFHAGKSSCDNILVHAGDTDIFMYGLALYEQCHFQQKKVCVERVAGAEYVSIDSGCAIICGLPEFLELSQHQQACVSLLAIYLLSGSDYISGFFRLSSEFMLKVFVKYLSDIIKHGLLVKMDHSGKIEGLSEITFARFMSYVYLEKHIKLFKHLYSSVPQLEHALLISNGTFNTGLTALLSWLQYDMSTCRISGQQDFSDFVRRICFFNGTNSPDLFKTIMPSNSALALHCARGEYVLKLAMESVKAYTDTYKRCNNGWITDNNTILIKWEENIETIKKDLKVKRRRGPLVVKCTCQSCGLTGRGCVSCWKKCLGCSDACACKGLCANPHNMPGGTCDKCKITPEEVEMNDEDIEEEEEVEENNDLFGHYFQDGDLEGMCEIAPLSTLEEFDELS